MEKMLNDEIKNQVKDVFKELKNPVVVLFFEESKDQCEYCEDTKQLLEEVVQLSDKLSLMNYDLNTDAEIAKKYRVDKVPGFVVAALDGEEISDFGVRFAGIPAGHEFTSLIRNILMVSSRDSGLGTQTREFLADLKEPVHLQVFVTPTCPYCPQAVILAHQLAVESPFVEAEMVEATEFPELSNQYGVSGVPHTVLNHGAGEAVGAIPETHLVEKIQQIIA
jgi:glutaredoxin-like protein